MTPAQSRAARALLGWKVSVLAQEAGVSVSAVTYFETGSRKSRHQTVTFIKRAFRRAGIVFIPKGVILND